MDRGSRLAVSVILRITGNILIFEYLDAVNFLWISEITTKIEEDVSSFTTALLSGLSVAEDDTVLRFSPASTLTLLSCAIAVVPQGRGVHSVFRVYYSIFCTKG